MGTRKRRSKEFWQRHVLPLQSSGQTQRLYCATHRLSRSTFDRWKRRIAARPPEQVIARAFVPLRVHGSPASESLQLRWPSGVSLSLSPGCDPVWLAQVLSGVR